MVSGAASARGAARRGEEKRLGGLGTVDPPAARQLDEELRRPSVRYNARRRLKRARASCRVAVGNIDGAQNAPALPPTLKTRPRRNAFAYAKLIALVILLPFAAVFIYAGIHEYRRYKSEGSANYGLVYDEASKATHVVWIAEPEKACDPESFDPSEDNIRDATAEAAVEAETETETETNEEIGRA